MPSGEMAQWVKAIVAKPDDLSLIPGSHLVEEENELIPVSCPPTSACVPWYRYVGEHTHTNI